MKVVFSVAVLLFLAFKGYGQQASQLYDTGVRAFEDGLYSTSRDNFTALLREYPESPYVPEAAYMLGVSFVYSGNFYAAIELLAPYSKRYPEESARTRQISYWLGIAYYTVDEYEKALNAFTEQLLHPDETLYYQRAALYGAKAALNLELYNEAEELIEPLFSTTPTERELIYESLATRGSIYMMQKRYPEAQESYTQLLLEGAGRRYEQLARFSIIECSYFSNNYKDAKPLYEAFRESYPDSDYSETALYRLAYIAYAEGETEKSLELVRTLMISHPNSSFLREGLRIGADVAYRKGDLEEVSGYYEDLLSLIEEEEEKQKLYYNLFVIAAKRESHQEGLPYLKEAAKGPSPQVQERALYYLGRYSSDDPNKEYNYYRELIDTFPESSYIDEAGPRIVALLRFLKPEDVIPFTETLINTYSESSNLSRYHFVLGEEYFNKSMMTEALEHFGKSIANEEDGVIKGEALYRVGYIYASRQEFSRSVDYFKEIIAIDNTTDPLVERALLALGTAMFNYGDYDNALGYLNQLNSEYPQSGFIGESCFAAGSIEKERGNHRQAQNYFRRAEVSFSSNERKGEALYQQAHTLYKQKLYSDAKDLFLQVTKKYPNSQRHGDALFQAGLSLILLDQYNEALPYMLATEKHKLSLKRREEALFYQGWIYLAIGEDEKAVETLNSLYNQFPTSELPGEALYRKGEFHYSRGESNEAKKWYQICYDSFTSLKSAPQSLMRLATIEYDGGTLTEALRQLTLFFENYPNSSLIDAAIQLAEETLLSIGEASKTEPFIEAVEGSLLEDFYKKRLFLASLIGNRDLTEANREKVQPLTALEDQEIAASSYYFLGLYSASRGESTASLTSFQESARRGTNRVSYYASLRAAELLERENRYDEAANECIRGFYKGFDQENAPGLLYKAYRLYQQSGNYEQSDQVKELLLRDFSTSKEAQAALIEE